MKVAINVWQVLTDGDVGTYIKESLRDLNGYIRFEKFKKIVMDEKSGGIQGEAQYIKAVQGDGQHGQLGYGKKISLSAGGDKAQV